MTPLKQFREVLKKTGVSLKNLDTTKSRPVITESGALTVSKFSERLIKLLDVEALNYPDVFKATRKESLMLGLIQKYVDRQKAANPSGLNVPKEFRGFTLNMNMAAKKHDERFFITYSDETVARITGDAYISICNMKLPDAVAIARKVIPEYHPRGQRGVYSQLNPFTGKKEDIFNSYTPPAWMKISKKEWVELPDRLPPLFLKLIRHLIPLKKERQYFYAWLHESLFSRSFVYLVLCSPPGTGKNRLKLVLRALHGQENTVDGKKSTLTERFNAQLQEATLAWFDELKYDSDMENIMKEYQNDYVSIEKKGVDATKSSRIYTSMVISNNKPRDNFIAFDARKFAPLVLADDYLTQSMTAKEIDTLTKKVSDQSSPEFDPLFLAQIAKWIKKNGKDRRNRWPNLEYRGPMFWTLAHTSMTRWQKRAVTLVLEQSKSNIKIGWDETEGGYLWSTLLDRHEKRQSNKSSQFPDYSSVQAFFEVFRDSKGEKAFDTKLVPGKNIMGDFWVIPLKKDTEVVTESSVNAQREMKRRHHGTEEDYSDL